MSKNFIDYQEELIECLKDPEEAIAYLNTALMDDDERIFLLALKNVFEAQGSNISTLAKKSRLNAFQLSKYK